MEFGSVDIHLLDSIDFKLTAEPAFNTQTLPGQRAAQPKVHIGSSFWGGKEWVGTVYPRGTNEADYMGNYTKQFDIFELNATHYKIYDAATIEKWAARADGRDFLFCPKIPQTISHYSTLTNTREVTTAFLSSISHFGPHLGPVFMQMGERFGPSRVNELVAYAKDWPRDVELFIELRQPGWFTELGKWEYLVQQLRDLGIGIVITDTAGRRDCSHMHLTTTKTLVRFVGNNGHPTDRPRLDDWANRTRYWIEQGLEEMYFILHMHGNEQIAPTVVYFGNLVEAQCGIPVKKPIIRDEPTQTSLF
ncbi:uncharacterized protein YecE (DUF72 family) [Chitinophaga skermanii]|uniref:Uncharacterized protein YecE (DUF72 family) n=1 Tax=Chitinophaga skermanii TaxID=331697 RepID=A0A327QWT4_9BACT|nr:DUF72 domain-containing protein [Chitinophaga skermanii]RAJ08415.1 uncharacterized protein YecE (DUF72 family) [Chitinophaga skermanii]